MIKYKSLNLLKKNKKKNSTPTLYNVFFWKFKINLQILREKERVIYFLYTLFKTRFLITLLLESIDIIKFLQFLIP